MASVWYIGTGWQRKITAADWATAGISGRPTVEWNKSNGWSIPHSQFTTAQLTMLDGDANFLLNQADGPRTKPYPAPDPETDNKSAYGYYRALKDHILGNPGVYKGDPGDKGDKGDDGDEGPPGPPGPLGTALFFQGLFNAETHYPLLADITGSRGEAWLVQKSGTRNFGSGPIALSAGDWVLHDGTKYIYAAPELLASVGLVVFHGSNADYARPGQAVTVIWVGEVTPNNIIDGDVFINIGGVEPNIVTTVLNSMNVGAPFSQMIHADGTVPMVWSLFSGSLPAGIVLSTEGNIHGTPSASGAYSFTLKAVNAYGEDTQAFSGTIGAAIAPTITTTALNTLYAGVGFSQTLVASGSTPITWSVQSGSLPTGLTLNTSTGVISGTVSATGAYSFTIRATNGVGYDDQAFTGSVSGVAPIITTTSLGPLWRAFAVSGLTVAASGSATITYAVTAGSLPAGLSLNTSTGAITGTPSATGSYSFTITATNSYGSDDQAYSGSVSQSTPVISTTTLNAIKLNTAFSQTLALSSGGPTITWTVQSGTLPTGLTLNSSTGAIAGTPTVSGAYSFTIRASNGAEYDDQEFSGSVTVPQVSYDAVGTIVSALSTTSVTSVISPSEGSTVIAFALHSTNTGMTTISATCGGVSMEKIGASTNVYSAGGYAFYVTAFKLQGVTSGSKNVVFSTPSSAVGIKAGCVSYLSVASVSSTIATAGGGGTSISLPNVVSDTNHMVANMIFASNNSISSYNKTQRAYLASGAWTAPLLIGDAAGASLVSFTATAGQSGWGAIAVDLAA